MVEAPARAFHRAVTLRSRPPGRPRRHRRTPVSPNCSPCPTAVNARRISSSRAASRADRIPRRERQAAPQPRIGAGFEPAARQGRAARRTPGVAAQGGDDRRIVRAGQAVGRAGRERLVALALAKNRAEDRVGGRRGVGSLRERRAPRRRRRGARAAPEAPRAARAANPKRRPRGARAWPTQPL